MPLSFGDEAKGLNRMASLITRRPLCAAVFLAFWVVAAHAQSRGGAQAPPSDLARQNFEHVAASAAQVGKVLHNDAGLMVELKRWVARDATDHGQLVSDMDLTDQAIYDRLESDVQFRSVATALLQKYGYLLPQLNPESPQGKEQQLLIQDRAKWIAQEEEERLTQARQQRNRTLEQARSCDPRQDADCSVQKIVHPSAELPERMGTPVLPQERVPFGNPNMPLGPQANSSSVEHAQLATQESGSPGTARFPGGRSDDPVLPVSGNVPQAGPGTLIAAAQTTRDLSTSLTHTKSSDQFRIQATASPLAVGSLASGPGLLDRPLSDVETSVGTDGYPQSVKTGVGAYAPGTGLAMQPNPRGTSPELNRAMVRQPVPYLAVPSLYDMYLQAAPQPPAPERFGMQVFEYGSRDPQMIPFDLPMGPDYVVGPGDGLSIDLWGSVSQRLLRTVDREGRVSLPEVGPLLVAGKSLADVQQSVQKVLRSQFRDVSADVSLSRLRTIRVYVVGDVAHPGAYDIRSLSTPLNALFAAGGPTSQGSLRIVKHNRGNQTVQDVDVYDLLLHGVRKDIQRLENGDTVLVPPIGPAVAVEGMVRRPAIYEVHDEKSLSDVLTLAGGLLPTATLRHIEVQRVDAHDKRTMLSVDVQPDADPASIVKQLDTFQVQDGDKVRIFPIAPHNQDTIYLEGHVLRPGRYSYRPGMRVTDLVSSFKDLLPEPASQYAEIIRLNAPDYRPSVESFNLGDALADPGSSPLLQPLDTVQVFGRYDFEEPPIVSVWGDVRSPGTYQTSGQIHLGDAIQMAGGLSPDAEKEDAQVFRYLPDGQLKIFSVKLAGALAGDPAENIALNSRDRILVHRNPASVEPSTVYIQGEVARPGHYPLTTNMTVADLVRTAGGTKQSADVNHADLTHYQWTGSSRMTGQHEEIELASAVSGDTNANRTLHNGDVLTIRKLPGWDDLGASITVRGEVAHPGTYGIRPGEKLSSVLRRAGGFMPDAYAYGAVLIRSEVQQREDKSQAELIGRVRAQEVSLVLAAKTAKDADDKLAAESAYQQWQSTIDSLTNNPPVGRVTIQISNNLKRWEGTVRDIEVRAGDKLVIPKKPNYVMVQGQVYNPTAIGFQPGKSAKWYLAQAGGPTNLANKKAICVIRADGSVIGNNALGEALSPGDTIVVPEKAIGGPSKWKAIFQGVQVTSAVTTSALFAAKY